MIEAVQRLSQQSDIDIRLDSQELRDSRIKTRHPVSFVLGNRQLQTALEVLLSELELTWMLRDGVLWITSNEQASAELITAVYDVRDLCGDKDESAALQAAIQSQTGALWTDVDGEGGTIIFAKPGTMVVRHTDQEHGNVLRLLSAYRSALKNSKRRERNDGPDAEVLTRYYSMQQTVAESLQEFLLRNVEPQSPQRPH